MKQINVKRTLPKLVEIDASAFETRDGKQFDKKPDAIRHESLLDEFPNFSEFDIEWLEGFMDDHPGAASFKQFQKDVRSDKVLILIDHSGGEQFEYEVIEPRRAAVLAVIQVLHARSVGCNYNMYVAGVIWRKASLSFVDPRSKKSKPANTDVRYIIPD